MTRKLSASAVALYEQIFLRHLESDPRFQPDLVYSDYKTLRFAYSADSPALRAHLARVYEATAKEYAEALARYRDLTRLYDFEGSALRDPQRWHLAGVGTSADKAATAARLARYLPRGEKPGVAPIQDFGSPEVKAALTDRLEPGRVPPARASPRACDASTTRPRL